MRTFAPLLTVALGLLPARGSAEEPGDFAPTKVPFDFADFSWVSGNYAPPDRPLAFGPFAGELRVDTVFHHSLAHPRDNTLTGSTMGLRHGEFQLTHLGIGGDFYWKGVHARVMTQLGLYSQAVPRNDASPARGQWRLDDAYRYLAEAYAGYRIDELYGINLQAGLFMSYIGLWSHFTFDNWTYQPSYVSANTPFFFVGARGQIFVDRHLKIEPWLVNGWQAYGRFNEAPGVGGQILWRPTSWLSIVSNNYGGADTLGNRDRARIHTDNSVAVKYFEDPKSILGRAAFSVTVDAGCEWGGGVTCEDQSFLGFMAYHRVWLFQERFAVTVGGGAIRNPGRYLVLLPPINGATATSGTPYFSAAPGDGFDAWDTQGTLDFYPSPHVLVRAEIMHRAASVPYFAGSGGVTPPGGNQGPPGSLVEGWSPDLDHQETRFSFAFGVRL